jgi:hypothetical protein
MSESRENILSRIESHGRAAVESELHQLQTTLFVMCGGGFLGLAAARCPRTFYIDARAGKLPFSRSEISRVAAMVADYAEVLRANTAGFEFRAHACGIL